MVKYIALVMMCCVTMSCSDPPGGHTAHDADRDLPRWEGNQQMLFDDTIHPSSVGMSLDGQTPLEDPLLKERILQADIVARMRVNTITVDQVGARVTYVLNLQVGQPALIQPKWEATNLELAINQSMSAFAIVRSLDSGIQGKTFIGFIKRFVRPDLSDETMQLHWHLTADTAEVAEAIQQIAALEDVSSEQ